jgi:hypothetical protein
MDELSPYVSSPLRVWREPIAGGRDCGIEGEIPDPGVPNELADGEVDTIDNPRMPDVIFPGVNEGVLLDKFALSRITYFKKKKFIPPVKTNHTELYG